MIISRTPFRVSFFGGGSDYPDWYREHGGAVLAGSIDRFCYLSCRWFPNYFDARYRIVYSRIELAREIEAIEHPSVRACLRHMGIHEGVEIVHNADLPARSGLGSSSAFTVGLLNCLHALRGLDPDQQSLAELAIHLEQNVMCENVGSQDQMTVAHGGLNHVTFTADGCVARPIAISARRLAELESHFLLVWTGLSRNASDIAQHQIRNIPDKRAELKTMQAFVDMAVDILAGGGDIADFGRLMHESWKLKRTLSSHITTPLVDDAYAAARRAGALGGKLLGAGGGGFLLIMARPEDHASVRGALSDFLWTNLKFESDGSQIIFNSAHAPTARGAATQSLPQDQWAETECPEPLPSLSRGARGTLDRSWFPPS
ncbi:MAG: kinase [Rhodospirillaceae bacterium]|nr:kinase [Rhodospirillaceae bacterium]